MSNEENPEQQRYGQPGPYDGWQPTPQSGEYDAEATAFVHLPPEDLANDPLAAPGQGYVPPMILPLTPAAGLDPAATGSWVVQTPGQQDRTGAEQTPPPEAVHWPDPNQQYQERYQETSSITADTTAQWNFTETAPGAAAEPHGPGGYEEPRGYEDQSEHAGYSGHPAHPGHDTPPDTTGHTGQWTIPVANGDLPEESGEFAASALASQWRTDTPPPATLPGGAPAPWATQLTEPEPVPEPEHEPAPAEAAGATAPEPGPETDTAPDTREPSEPPESPETADRPEPTESTAPTAPTDSSDTPAAASEAPDPDAVPVPDPVSDPAPAHIDVPSEHPAASYVLHVNGADRPVSDAWIGESLLYVLRERLGLAGAKDGCSQGECGACNVQVDGRLVASCLVPAATAAGSEVRTVEGLAVDGEPSDVQRALADCGAVQCGFCIPGMAMTVHDLLEGNHAPSELETRQALCGNLCRCSGYRGVLDAVREVVAGREANAEAAAAPAPDAEEVRIPHQAAPGAGSVQAHPHEGDAR